jgi:Mrp family chromosome partitioning ATPase
VVRKVMTFFCEQCGTGYDSFEVAQGCEDSGQATLQEGDVILRSAVADEVFEVERDALVWGVVTSVRSLPGTRERPSHQHFYQTGEWLQEVSQERIEFLSHGALSMEEGLMGGPAHTRQISVLLDTYPDMRQHMADCFAVLSSLTPHIDLTPEAYAQWDDLRYTAYDFGATRGDAPISLPFSVANLLCWCAEAKPVEDVHRALFYKPRLGLHGGPLVYAPFDDNVGFQTKWLIGEGDPYRYLRYHLQPLDEQYRELSVKQAHIMSGQRDWCDRLEDLFICRSAFDPDMGPAVLDWANEMGVTGSPEEVGHALYQWLMMQQERWREPVNVTPTVVPNHIPVIAVAAGKGGVGKSTVAAQLARSLAASGLQPLFLDLDFYGPSAPTEFGLTEPLRLENGYIQPHVKDGVRVVSIGNMIPADRALHWRGPVLEAFIHLVTAHVRYDGVDAIVLDCPPGTGDVQLGIFHRIRPWGALLVSTASELALADVRRALASFREVDVPIVGLVENMSEILLDEGQRKRLFGTRERISLFCSEEKLRYLGSIPFVDTATDLFQHLQGVTHSILQALQSEDAFQSRHK